jgi:hypothetical protein
MAGRMTQDLVGRALFRAVTAKRPPKVDPLHEFGKAASFCGFQQKMNMLFINTQL